VPYICTRNQAECGRLAQLVQSISFTPRGSGVRIPHRPQGKPKHMFRLFLFPKALKIYYRMSTGHSPLNIKYKIWEIKKVKECFALFKALLVLRLFQKDQRS
jgi:hypothetical protein